MKNYVVLLVVFLSWVGVAHASLEITEVMYDSDGTDIDWVEIYNPDNSNVDVTKIKLLVGDSTESNHGISSYSNSQYLHKGEYGVIVSKSQISSFISKWGNSIIIFSSSDFSLPNLSKGGEGKVFINNGDKNSPLDSVIYTTSDGGNGNGNSLSGDLEELTPTPGTANSSNNSSDNLIDNTVDETIDPIPLIIEDPLVFKITTKIISPKIVVAGIPFLLSSLTTTNTGKTYNFGKFIWNFGDGMQVEVKESKPFDYIYEYPGEYILTISYFDNSFTEIADATDRIIIKVIPSDVYISSVGTDSDPYIELENKSNYEVTLSGWIIKGGDKTFIFPEGTTLLQGKKIKLSPKITGFTALDIKYITILNPSNEVVTTYPVEKKKIVQAYGVNNSNYNNSVSVNDAPKDITSQTDLQIINLNDLGASASDAKVRISSLTYSIIGLIVIIGLGIASFLFIKKKKEIPDYVERGVSAKDMTIIE